MANLRTLTSILILLLLTSFLSGCWDRRELEEQAFVLTLGVDKGTIPSSFLWTFQIAIPRQLAGGQTGGGGGGGGQKPSTIISVEATTLFGALNLINSFLDRKPNLMHAKAIVISEDLAREDPVPLRAFVRYREVRRNLFVLVAEGKAKEIISTYKPVLEQNPAKFIETLVLNSSYTGLMPKTQLHDYLTHMESRAIEATAILVGKSGGLNQPKELNPKLADPFLPGEIPREGGSPIEIIGTAIFKGGKMVGKLEGSENRVMAMLTGNFGRGFWAFPDPMAPGKNLALDIRSGAPPVMKMEFKKGRPVINVHLSLEAEILAIQSNIDYTRLDMLNKLELYTERFTVDYITKVIKKTQGMGTDIFGFGNKARHLVDTWPQWEKLNWEELYPKAEIKVTVAMSIRRIGLQFQPANPAY